MDIHQRIVDVKTQIADELRASGGTTSKKADDLKNLGLDVIMKGSVEAWTDFMLEFFPLGSKELARLIPSDGTHKKGDMNKARAYLVANATCTPTTYNNLDIGVTVTLDEDNP